MRVTSKAIGKAIKEETGIDHIRLHNYGGYFGWYSDDEKTAEFIHLHDFSSTYIYRMSNFTVEQWVETFKADLNEWLNSWIDPEPYKERVRELGGKI